MRERFTERKRHLVQIELALEQHRHDARRRLRRRARGEHFSESIRVMTMLLPDALMQSVKRFAVRRQHQRVGRQHQQSIERTQVARQRIGVGFEIEHADVGRDARQHHVAGDQQTIVLAIQRRMLRRVTEADDDAKDALCMRRSDRDLIAFVDPMKAARHRRHQARVVARAALANLLQRLGIAQAVARKVLRRRLAADVVAAAGRQIASERILGGRHPQSHRPALTIASRSQPVREAEVIRMKMRADDAQQRLAGK